jgi:hypothetical protein
MGRVTHSSYHGLQPIAPSAITRDTAEGVVGSGATDMIAFDRLHVANR